MVDIILGLWLLALTGYFYAQHPLSGSIAGPQGKPGSVGPIGPQGPAGPPGPRGPSGTNGITGPQGPIGRTGPAGTQGPQGPSGPAGADGLQGPPGPPSIIGAPSILSRIVGRVWPSEPKPEAKPIELPIIFEEPIIPSMSPVFEPIITPEILHFNSEDAQVNIHECDKAHPQVRRMTGRGR